MSNFNWGESVNTNPVEVIPQENTNFNWGESVSPEGTEAEKIRIGVSPTLTEKPKKYEAIDMFKEIERIKAAQEPVKNWRGREVAGGINEREILNSPSLMKGIREIMKSRYSPETRNKYSLDERYDATLSDYDTLQEWQNWMRSLTGGQTVTTGNDVAWFAMADDDQRKMLGASLTLMESMPGIFSREVTAGETWDGIKDYVKAGVWDPSTAIGLGVGRFWTYGAAKTAAFATRKLAIKAFEEAVKKGLSKEAANEIKLKTLRESFKAVKSKAALKAAAPMIAGTSSDMAFSVVADRGYQYLNIGSGVQDEYSLPQSVGAALGVIVMPSLFAGAKLGKETLSKSLGFKNYRDVISLHGDKGADVITKEVIKRVDLGAVDTSLNRLFTDFNANIEKYTPWSIAREEAAETVSMKDIAGSPDRVNDLFESTLLFGSKENTKDGLIYSLAEAGFVYVPRGKDDNVSNFIGDVMAYLPEDTVKGMIEAIKPKIGDGVFKSSGLSDINTPEALSAWFKNRSRFAGKTLFNRKAAADLLKKQPDEITAFDMLNLHKTGVEITAANASGAQRVKYIQSIWKRLLTAHPGTTGVNVKGWAYTTYMNSKADLMLGAVLGLTGKGQEAKGSILGALRRGFNVLNPHATVEQGLKYLELRPEVAKELLSEIAGGVEQRDILERLNLDPKSKLNKATEATVSGIQTAMGVKLQDEMTKMISFMSALDQQVRKVYGEDFNTFMARPDSFVEMHSSKFLNEVQEPAIIRAKKETYSYSWLSKTDKPDPLRVAELDLQAEKAYKEAIQKGSSKKEANKIRQQIKREGAQASTMNPYLYMAQQVESFSNSSYGGFLVPFGRFFNTSMAMLGDYTGFNALRYVTAAAYKKDKSLGVKRTLSKIVGKESSASAMDEEFKLLFSKGLIGASVMYGKLPGGKSEVEKAEERIKEGLLWSQERLDDGSIKDWTYDQPEAYVKLIAQTLAYKQVDGKVPPALRKELLDMSISQLTREPLDAVDTLKGYADIALSLEPDAILTESLKIMGAAFSKIASGGTRFLDPLNTAAMFATGDFSTPDRRQGNEFKNQAVKYVEKIPLMFGFESDIPKRNFATKGDRAIDVGAKAFGVRSSTAPTPSERVAGSIGMKSWKVSPFKGEPEFKNRLDGLIMDILNHQSQLLIEDGYLGKKQNTRINDYNNMVLRVKKITMDILKGSTDADDTMLVLQDKLLKQKKMDLETAMEVAGYSGRVEDLKDLEGGKEKMQFLLYLIEDKDKLLYNK